MIAGRYNYIETDQEREEGHQDTRQRNFECDNPDKHFGCDMGIDVQGEPKPIYDSAEDDRLCRLIASLGQGLIMGLCPNG
jgi:hypothetical protein